MLASCLHLARPSLYGKVFCDGNDRLPPTLLGHAVQTQSPSAAACRAALTHLGKSPPFSTASPFSFPSDCPTVTQPARLGWAVKAGWLRGERRLLAITSAEHLGGIFHKGFHVQDIPFASLVLPPLSPCLHFAVKHMQPWCSGAIGDPAEHAVWCRPTTSPSRKPFPS